MSFERYFLRVDYHIDSIDSEILEGKINPEILSIYAGFLAVSAVAAYEQAIKEILITFSRKKHNVFGDFTQASFEKLNGRITLKNLRDQHIKKFGDRYLKRFNKILDQKEDEVLKNKKASIKSSYGRIIDARHKFAHEGNFNLTYDEAKSAYAHGKHVIECLNDSMVR